MNNTTLQIKFKQRLNKIASDDYDNIECWQIVEAFNKAQIEWCRRQLHGTNNYREGDEMSKRRVDDLQLLLSETPLIANNTLENYVETANIPTNYLEFKRVSAFATSECCPEPARSMTVYLAEEANVDLIMRDALKRPDFDWGETYCTMLNDKIRVYKRDFDISSIALTYYRKPRNIQIEGCVDPYTTQVTAADVICEFKDDICELIIDEAVSIIAGDIADINNYTREMQAAERNN
jgi:hypothetical protein|tara:strand:+ start:40 stop:747 length:708 start_codon:yes stop_codon:yes gene_type:complete